MLIKYLVVHNKHEGCYDYKCYQDDVARIRLTSITINPPKIYMFNTREEAQEFFEEYINDVDCIDIRCKRGDDVEHMDYCSCGVIELDDKGEPVLFYNKKNQIFLLENGPQVFMPNQEVKNDIRNFNLTNKLIRKCKSLAREQRDRYIELGKFCEECNLDTDTEEDDKKKEATEHVEPEVTSQPTPSVPTTSVPPPVAPEKKPRAIKKKKDTVDPDEPIKLETSEKTSEKKPRKKKGSVNE